MQVNSNLEVYLSRGSIISDSEHVHVFESVHHVLCVLKHNVLKHNSGIITLHRTSTACQGLK